MSPDRQALQGNRTSTPPAPGPAPTAASRSGPHFRLSRRKRSTVRRHGVLVKNYHEAAFLDEFELLQPARHARILNAGSASVRFGKNCVNVDIQAKPNVDIVADMQALPANLANFDAVICSASLQYCEQPRLAAAEFYRVLKPGGLLFVDAPWVQPYCPDTPDRYRFSQEALRNLFSDFEVLRLEASIRPGAAFAYLGVELARSLTNNRYLNFLTAKLAEVMLLPLSYVRTNRESDLAGAFYLIARKPSVTAAAHPPSGT